MVKKIEEALNERMKIPKNVNEEIVKYQHKRKKLQENINLNPYYFEACDMLFMSIETI